MAALYEWDEQFCRSYADGLRPMIRFDHARWAERIANDLAGLAPGASILDVAGGPGFLLVELGRRLPGARLIAHDQAAPMLALASEEAHRAGLQVDTVCSPAEALALPDASVDVVVCKQLLHEAVDVGRTLAELTRVLKPSGSAYIIDFDADGSRVAALTVRAVLLLTRGRVLARSFWRSFRAGLPGRRVREMALEAGFRSAEYERAGFYYFVRAWRSQKPPPPPPP